MTTNEQKIKKSDKGFNIFSRVITVLIAAATYPVMVFTSLFYLAYTIPYISVLTGDTTDTGASYFKASIYELLRKDGSYWGLINTDGFKSSDVLEILKIPLIAIGCLYAALAVLALLIIIFAAFTKKKIPIVVFSVLGIGVLSFIPLGFSRLQAPFLDGTINLDSFLHTGLSSLMDLVVKVDFIRAGEAYTLLWVIFIAILAWTGAVMLVNMGDESKKVKEPKVKKAKKEKASKEKAVEE